MEEIRTAPYGTTHYRDYFDTRVFFRRIRQSKISEWGDTLRWSDWEYWDGYTWRKEGEGFSDRNLKEWHQDR